MPDRMTTPSLEDSGAAAGGLRVLIAAEHASSAFGGEAALALHYFRVLRRRGIPTWLVVHDRTRPELEKLFPGEPRMVFVRDSAMQRLLWRLGTFLPARLSSVTFVYAIRLLTQLEQRRIVRRLVREQRISVVHQPMPVSPKEPSILYGLGAPVIIGPMNGGMDYPAAFRKMQNAGELAAIAVARGLSTLINRLMPGKREAALLLVANERTRAALPDGVGARVEPLVENGVDLGLWRPEAAAAPPPRSGPAQYVFLGRLVDWKAVDFLLQAFVRAAGESPMSLSIVGDGPERRSLEALAENLGILDREAPGKPGRVHFLGWKTQAECAATVRRSDALVLPSLMECGGAVVLEAMSMAVPVVATAWGGPADYLDSACGILVEPTSREALIGGIAAALVRLAKNPEERRALGRAGREKVLRDFDWEVKVDRMLDHYRQVAGGPSLG
jgi:glycosyltransferase involved in cell wall biosynthesis